MRVLITGVSGMLGSNIAVAAASRDWHVVGTWHSCPVVLAGAGTLRLDVTDAGSWREAVSQVSPDVIVHNAASVELLRLENDQALARGNVQGAVLGVGAAVTARSRFVLVSSDWVFDGGRSVGRMYREDDARDAVNAYGRSKSGSEDAVHGGDLDGLITRPANVYGVNLSRPVEGDDAVSHVLRRSSLAVRWLSRLSAGESIRGPADIYQSPTYASSYAEQLCDLIATGATGTYHTAGPESMHRLDYMRALAATFELDTDLVDEAPTAQALVDMLEDPAAADLTVPHNTALCVDKVGSAVSPQVGVDQGHRAMREQLSILGIDFSRQSNQEGTVE